MFCCVSHGFTCALIHLVSWGSWILSRSTPPFFLPLFSLAFPLSYVLPSYRPKRLYYQPMRATYPAAQVGAHNLPPASLAGSRTSLWLHSALGAGHWCPGRGFFSESWSPGKRLWFLVYVKVRKMRFFFHPLPFFKEAFSKCSGFITSLLIGIINF